MDYIRLSWNDIERQCKTIAKEIRARKVPFDIIVGIARGGWAPARILSDLLANDEIYTIRVKFYKAVGKTTEKPLILHPTQFDVTGKNILLVDDIADTGKSLVAAVEHLKARKAGNIFVTTLVRKPQSIFTPDFYVKETSDWVVFPWEVQETIRDIAAGAKSKTEFIKEMKKAKVKESEYKEVVWEKWGR